MCFFRPMTNLDHCGSISNRTRCVTI
jgi:hypothetical protein